MAASYVTSFPCLHKAYTEDDLKGLAKYLPAVGVFIGVFLAASYLLFAQLSSSEALRSFLLVLCWLAITGCIHLDGLMDAADGLFSHRSKERMLEIMKDSRVGNFGVITGVMLILAKFSTLASLNPSWIIAAVLIIPAWARWAEVFAIAVYPYAKEEGMGKVWHDSTELPDLVRAAIFPALFTASVCFYFHSYVYALLPIAAIVPGLIFSHRVCKILNGHTGDTYGATVELSEAAALIILALLQEILN